MDLEKTTYGYKAINKLHGTAIITKHGRFWNIDADICGVSKTLTTAYIGINDSSRSVNFKTLTDAKAALTKAWKNGFTRQEL